MVLLLQVYRELSKVRVFCSRYVCFVLGCRCDHQGRVYCLLMACRCFQLDQADKNETPQVGLQSGKVDFHCDEWGCSHDQELITVIAQAIQRLQSQRRHVYDCRSMLPPYAIARDNTTPVR